MVIYFREISAVSIQVQRLSKWNVLDVHEILIDDCCKWTLQIENYEMQSNQVVKTGNICLSEYSKLQDVNICALSHVCITI